MIQDAYIICAKDLRLELRARVATNQVLPFVFAVLLLFAFALDPDSGILRRATSGLFWVTVLFASVLVIQRSFSLERDDGIPDALRLSGLRPSGIFLGKTASLVLQLLVVEALLFAGVVVFYDVTLSGVGLLGAATAVATIAIAAAGALYGPLVAGLRSREASLPLLLLPVLAPVLLAATRSFEVALGRGVGRGWPWIGMLGVFAALYLVLGTVLWGPLQEAT